jgi:hypothetical protein
MIRLRQLPEDPSDWEQVVVELPRLDVDSPASCPMSSDEILEYVRTESADLDEADAGRLRFVRTARFKDARCWIWSYVESDETPCYVTFWARKRVETLGMSEASPVRGGFVLTPEQYALAEYYDLVCW